MARKTPNRLELRKQAEAAEAMESEAEVEVEAEAEEDESSDEAPKKKKKAVKKKAAPRAKRTKAKTITRKRLVWGVFSSSMKEEARFAYHERELADQKVEALTLKNKRTYFVQPIKEALAEQPPPEGKEPKKKA
jgi:hypothetical protein